MAGGNNDDDLDVIYELFPSTAQEWSPEMIDQCRRPIVELLTQRFLGHTHQAVCAKYQPRKGT